MQILPVRSGSAAENMALDFLLLQRFPEPEAPRFRHYGWHRPAFTFGYSQKIAAIRAGLPPDETFDLCRRATGGGLVDHREDWTYMFVIPRGHPLEEERAAKSYQAVHEALAAALRTQGANVATKPLSEFDPGPAGPAGVCFQQAEVFDVIHVPTGRKIAGAAQKRNKRGLLLQGSIWRPAVDVVIDWERFHDEFTTRLGALLNRNAEPAPWPEFNEDEVNGLIEQYASPEWLEAR